MHENLTLDDVRPIKTFRIDIAKLPMFKFYVFYLSIRYFFFAYYYHLKSNFSRMRYGTILKTLISPLTLLVHMYRLVETHLLVHMKMEMEAYRVLSGEL